MQVTLNSYSGGSMESQVWEDTPGLRENLKPFYFRQERMVVRVTREERHDPSVPERQDSRANLLLFGSISVWRPQLTRTQRCPRLLFEPKEMLLEASGAGGRGGG